MSNSLRAFTSNESDEETQPDLLLKSKVMSDDEKSEALIRQMIEQNPGEFEQLPSGTYAELIQAQIAYDKGRK